MNDLELKIYNAAKEKLSDSDWVKKVNEALLKEDILYSRINIPFICEGVVDYLVICFADKRIEKITYTVGSGSIGLRMEGSDSGLFEFTEQREINVSSDTEFNIESWDFFKNETNLNSLKSWRQRNIG